MEKIDELKIALGIAERIKTERCMRRISQEELASRLGTTQSKISKLETASKGGGTLSIGEIIHVADVLGCRWEYLVTGGNGETMTLECFHLDSVLKDIGKSSFIYTKLQKDFPACNGWDDEPDIEEGKKDNFVGTIEICDTNNDCHICIASRMIIGVFGDEMITCYDDDRSIPEEEVLEPCLVEVQAFVYHKADLIGIYKCFVLAIGHLVLLPDDMLDGRVGGELDSTEDILNDYYFILRAIRRWIKKNSDLEAYLWEDFGDREYPFVMTTDVFIKPAFRNLGLYNLIREAISSSLQGKGFFVTEKPSPSKWIECINILPYPIMNDEELDNFYEELGKEGDEGKYHRQTILNKRIADKSKMNVAIFPDMYDCWYDIPSNSACNENGLNDSITQMINIITGNAAEDADMAPDLNDEHEIFRDNLQYMSFIYYKIPEALLLMSENSPSIGLKEEMEEELKDEEQEV